ncbi:MAG TPA: hypothetical protein VGO11_26450 [Chthoniobacteraceae bacterium]|nr:hypothetical protein [Chthoniobacteraceae bacterium]
MKSSHLVLAALLLSAGMAFGDLDTNLSDLRILQTPSLSAEEMKQILFSSNFENTNMNVFGLRVQVHNPFRDKSIRGIVVSVHTKAGGQEQTIQAFCDLSCGPLQSTWSYIELFNAEELAKLSPVVKLTEVHREAQAEPEPAPQPAVAPPPTRNFQSIPILETPTFTPEEMKEFPFIAKLYENPPRISVELHNPFRNKSIRGIVLQVQYKSADGKEHALDIFDFLECAPLKNAQRSVEFYNSAEIMKSSPVITLKEVHRGE